MRIALLADTHLSDITGTPQEESFLWAIEELKQLAPDACVWLGDITAGGSADAAMRFRATLDTLPFPSVTVPGNSDIRSPETAPIMERVLLNYPEGLQCGDVRIVGVNTSHNLIDENERKRLLRLNVAEDILLCSHQAASFLDEATAPELTYWLKGKNALSDYLAQNTIDEANSYALGKPWSRVIWDITAVAWLMNEDNRFMCDRLIQSPIPEYDYHYAFDGNRHFIKYVYRIERDAVFEDLFKELTQG